MATNSIACRRPAIAIGFLGGGLLLAINLAWITSPGAFGLPDTSAGVRLSFLSVAIWWVVFSIPLFRVVPEPPVRLAQAMPLSRAIGASFVELGHTFRELKRFKQAFLMLLAFLIYNDGIQTIIRMASLYATQLGIGSTHLILAFLMVQFLGIPFTFLYGMLAGRIGAKPSIFLTLVVYAVIVHARLLHEDRDALLHARGARRDRAGRQPGAEPIALRLDDSALQVVGVLRLLLGVREVRGTLRTAAVRVVDRGVRIEPGGDSVGDCVLRGGRRDPRLRRCRRRPADRASGGSGTGRDGCSRRGGSSPAPAI